MGLNTLNLSLQLSWNGVVAFPKSAFKDLQKTLSGQVLPQYKKPGRSAELLLTEPLTTSAGEVHVVKIKGIGLFDHLGAYHPPSVKPYYRIHKHLGFQEDGSFTLVKSQPSPEGGMTLSRAKADFNNAAKLVTEHCPSIIPLSVYQITNSDLRFLAEENHQAQAEPLGISVSGYRGLNSERASIVLDSDDISQIPEDWRFNLISDAGLSSAREALLAGVLMRYGATLRKAHEAKMYRFSGGLDNYSYSSKTDDVYVIDIDTSRPLEECNELVKPLQLMRDVSSGMYGIFVRLLNEQNITRVSEKTVIDVGLFYHYLKGYYNDCDEDAIIAASSQMNEFFVNARQDAVRKHSVKKSGISSGSQFADISDFQKHRHQTQTRYWVDRWRAFTLFMQVVHPLHQLSSLGETVPHVISEETLQKNAAAFVQAHPW